MLSYDLEGFMYTGWWHPSNTGRDNDSQFFSNFSVWSRDAMKNTEKSGTTKTSDIMAWKNLMANDVIYGKILVFILDVYDYTEVLSWRMFWCSVIEPSQNVDAWMFLWPVTRLGFGWMAWLWRSDTQKDLGILMVWRYPILKFYPSVFLVSY